MKITFVQYLLLGFFGVFLCATISNKFMHIDMCPYRGTDRTVIWLTRNISQEGRKYGPRTFTFWNLSHVLYYAVGAYLFPDKVVLLWVLGALWEISESLVGCMNPLDIVWNTIGIVLGSALLRVQNAS
jgi:hypothetical protein